MARTVAVGATLALVGSLLALSPVVPSARAQAPGDGLPVDIVFVVDESRSMGGEIAAIRSNLDLILDELVESGLDFRIGVVGYSAGNRIYSTLSSDVEAISGGIAQLAANRGNPEAGFSATVAAMGGDMGHDPDAGTCQLLFSDEDADVTAAYPETKDDALAALNTRDAVFEAIVTTSGASETHYGPAAGSLADLTGGETFSLSAFTSDPQTVLEGILTDCIRYVEETAPLVADAGPDQTVLEGSSVALEGSTSGGGADDVTPSTSWELVSQEGPPITLSDGSSLSPSLRPLDDGRYTFRLTATAGDQTASDEMTVTVGNAEPVLAGDPSVAVKDGVVMVTAPFTDPGIADTHHAVVDWGDGSPPSTVPVLAQGTGWGEVQASHPFATNGEYRITFTLVDDDGGAAQAATQTAVVEDVVPPTTALGVALWANSQSAKNTIQVSGSHQTITGQTHSNRDLKVSGSSKTFTGASTYVGALQVSGGPTVVFDPPPEQTTTQAFPRTWPLADYQSGGRAALGAGEEYHDLSGECGNSWHPKGAIESGLYWVPCDVKLDGSVWTTGPVTIAAAGDIHVSGSGHAFESYVDGLLFASGDDGASAVQVSGSSGDFSGHLVSESGGVRVSGSGNDFVCGLLGDTIQLSGSQTTIDAASCPGAASGGVSEVELVAPPLLVPTLGLDLANAQGEVLPGESLDYEGEGRNDGSTLVVPAILGAQNLAEGPVAVESASFVVEYRDLATTEWVELASTGGGSAALLSQPNLAAGVSYPDSGDRITGTTIDPATWATWSAAGIVALSPAQLQLLLDPARVGEVRARLDLAMDPAAAAVRQVIGLDAALLDDLAAQRGDLADARVEVARPRAPLAVFDGSADAAWDLLAPGDGVPFATSGDAPAVPVRDGESDVDHLSRLRALDGQTLVGAAFATAVAGIGTVVAPPRAVTSTLGLPILELSVTAPGTVVAGGDAGVDVTVTNTGSRPAAGYGVTVDIDGDAVPLGGATPTLDPGGSVVLSGSVSTTKDDAGPLAVDTALTWSDAAGNTYGPLTDDREIALIEPGITPIRTGAVQGRFFDTDPGQSGFTTTPAQTPEFAQPFPNVAFNPPQGVVAGNETGIGPDTEHFTDVTTDHAGRATGTIPAQGNGLQAGVGDMDSFDSVFTGTFVVGEAGPQRITVIADDAFVFGIEGATRVAGVLDNAPPSGLTAFEGYPVMGAYNQPGSAPATYPITVDFPGPGVYAYELDYASCCDDQSTLVLTTTGDDETAGGGKVFVSGRDSDDHAVRGGNRTGARNHIRLAVGYVTNEVEDPRVLLVMNQTPTSGSGDPRLAMEQSGITDVDVADVGGTTGIDLATVEFADYDGVVVAGDWLRRPELDELITRSGDVAAYLEGGGGIVTFAGGSASSPHEEDRHDYLPCPPPFVDLQQDENSFTITPFGAELGLTNSDLNGNIAHYIFSDQCNLDVVALDGQGRLVDLATPGSIDGPTVVIPPTQIAVAQPRVQTNDVGQTAEVEVTLLDASGNPEAGELVTVDVRGSNTESDVVTTDAAGIAMFTYEGVAVGEDRIQASTFESLSNVVTATWDAAPPPPPGSGGEAGSTVGDCTPEDGATVTEPVEVSCEITAPEGETVESWRLVARPAGSDPGEDEAELASGTGTPPPVLGTFDPTVVDNGIWLLTVEVVDTGNGVGTGGPSVVVDGNLKLGRYNVTYQDLAVPVGGIPIRVLRTYDTLNKDQVGDFGHGWTLDVADFRVQTNGVLGDGGWDQYVCGGGFGIVQYCLRSEKAHYVTVTWPDGRTETFDFTPQGLNSVYPAGAIAKYTGRPAATSRLLPIAGDTNLGVAEPYVFDDPFRFTQDHILDPQRFILEAKDGTRYVLDVDDGLVEAKDRNGNTVTVDDEGIRSSLGPEISFERDADDRITSVTDPAGHTVHYAYDNRGDLATVLAQPSGAGSTFTYDQHALVTVDDQGLSPFSTLRYEDGRLVEIVDRAGQATQIAPDVNGLSELVTAPNGLTTTLSTFDERGNLVNRVEAFDGRTRRTSFVHDANGQLVSVTDPLLRTTTYTRDDTGEVTGINDANGKQWTIESDEYGQVTAVLAPDGSTYLSIEYDSTGQPVAVTTGAGTTTLDYPSRSETATSGSVGPATRVTSSPEGLVSSFAQGDQQFDVSLSSAADTASLEGPGGFSITSQLTAAGAPALTTAPGGRTYGFGFDQVGRVTTATDPLGRSRAFEYNGSGRLSRYEDRNGEGIAFEYDVLGNVTTARTAGETIVREYDGLGRLIAVEDDDVRIETQLDDLDRPSEVRTTGVGDASDMPPHAVGYSYDGIGNITSMTTAAGTVHYEYNDRYELVSIVDVDGSRIELVVDDSGRPTTIRRPNGVETDVVYGEGPSVESIEHRRPGAILDSREYEYDTSSGLLNRVTSPVGSSTFTYDDLGQLVSEDRPGSTDDRTYEYDEVGNRTTNGASYDAASQAISDSEYAYEFDQAGRLIRRTGISTGIVTIYEWDTLGRLVGLSSSDGVDKQFRYDPLGRRVSETSAGVTTWYGWSSEQNVIAEYDSSGSRVADYTTLPLMGGALSMRTDGAAYQLHADSQDTTTLVTDSAGEVVAANEYTAFGEPLTPPSSVLEHHWAGQRYDESTGLYYMRHRYYSPAAGRFISPDPAAAINPYEYAFNNPTAHNDPSGAISLSTYSSGADRSARVIALLFGLLVVGTDAANNGADLHAWINTGVRIAGGAGQSVAIGSVANWYCGTGAATGFSISKAPSGIACWVGVGAMTGALFGTVFKLTATALLEPENLTAPGALKDFFASMAAGAASGATYGAWNKGLVGSLFGGRTDAGARQQWEQLDDFLNRAMWE